jgi:hypothetical protein
MVSFFEDPGESMEGMDIARQAVIDEMVSLHPDVDVAALFRSAPAKSPSADSTGAVMGSFAERIFKPESCTKRHA